MQSILTRDMALKMKKSQIFAKMASNMAEIAIFGRIFWSKFRRDVEISARNEFFSKSGGHFNILVYRHISNTYCCKLRRGEIPLDPPVCFNFLNYNRDQWVKKNLYDQENTMACTKSLCARFRARCGPKLIVSIMSFLFFTFPMCLLT